MTSLFPHLIPVVYVDELEAGRNSFREHFQSFFELFTCSDASLALQVLQNRPGCVLLTHLRRAKASGIASGLDLISEVQQKFSSSQCILLHAEADTGLVDGNTLMASIFRSVRTPYAVPTLRSIIQRAYELTWNNMQMGAICQELETLRSARDWLTYKIDTEFFEPVMQLEALCRSVVEHQDTTPAHELAQFLLRRLTILGSGRARFRDLYRGSRVELLPENLEAHGLFRSLINSICAVYGLEHDRIRVEVIENSIWIGDYEKIKMVLLELLNNAARSAEFGQAPTGITLSAQIQADIVQLEVTDYGRGIAITQQERVFRLFERSETGNAFGMGLFIVRETVKQMGGDIHLKSEVGKGSTFQIRIPNLLSQQHRFAV
ncbi:MAG: ATP-binding protein [Bacteroidota bacterium]